MRPLAWAVTLLAPQVSQLESELRVAATKHEAALEELRLQHQQASLLTARSLHAWLRVCHSMLALHCRTGGVQVQFLWQAVHGGR